MNSFELEIVKILDKSEFMGTPAETILNTRLNEKSRKKQRLGRKRKGCPDLPRKPEGKKETDKSQLAMPRVRLDSSFFYRKKSGGEAEILKNTSDDAEGLVQMLR